MSNFLKIYDFNISSKLKGKNVTFYDLGIDKEFSKTTSSLTKPSDKIQRKIIFEGFKNALSSDLNIEKLKNENTKRIIKKSRNKTNKNFNEIKIDFDNNLIYGQLFSGKITENVTLEKINEKGDNDFEVLNKDRIYDNFFFLLHISFRCNIARLFVHTKTDSVPADSILKKYFQTNLFKSKSFNKTTISDFISESFKKEVLARSIVSQITISKSTLIKTSDNGDEYEVEIRLKPKKQNLIKNLSKEIINLFKEAKVEINNYFSDDKDSMIKISINDSLTKQTKTIVFGDEEGFHPKLLLSSDDVYTDKLIDDEKMKALCLMYIIYEKDKLLTK